MSASTRRRNSFLVGMISFALLVSAACGGGSADDPDVRTVEIQMIDTAFAPATVDVAKGETVRFVFENTGALPHDAFIGNADAQLEHGREMRNAGTRTPDSHGDHGEHAGGSAVTVKPGGNAELTRTFDETGSVEIGCHQPGHYEMGMKVAVDVT